MALTYQYEVFKISTRPDRQFTQGRSKIGKLAQKGGEQFDKIIERFWFNKSKQNSSSFRWLLLWSIFTQRKFVIETSNLKISSQFSAQFSAHEKQMNNSNAKIMKMKADNCAFKNNFEQTVALVTTFYQLTGGWYEQSVN